MEARVGTVGASVAELRKDLEKVRSALEEEITARQGLAAQFVAVSQKFVDYAEATAPGWWRR